MARNNIRIEPTEEHAKGLRKALKIFGSQIHISELLGLSRQSVCGWFSARNVIPAQHARRLEAISEGQLCYYDLRPDDKKVDKTIQKYLHI